MAPGVGAERDEYHGHKSHNFTRAGAVRAVTLRNAGARAVASSLESTSSETVASGDCSGFASARRSSERGGLGERSVFTWGEGASGFNTLGASGAKPTRACLPRTVNGRPGQLDWVQH